MDFYVVDRTYNLKTICSTSGETMFRVVSSQDTIELKNGSRRVLLDIALIEILQNTVKKLLL